MDALFCPGCGSSAQDPRQAADRPGGWSRGSAAALIAAAIVLTVAVGGGTVLMLRPATQTDDPPPPPDTSYPSPTTPTAPSAADTLRELADADRPYADQLVGYWVPQVSSKQVGVDGYDASSILREHRSTGSTRPDTPFLLVRSEDFSSFRSGGFWVTVAAVPHYTADEANQWCDSQGYPARDCYAKRLSHTEGYSGNAKPRG